jgi:hypothetical protein
MGLPWAHNQMRPYPHLSGNATVKFGVLINNPGAYTIGVCDFRAIPDEQPI